MSREKEGFLPSIGKLTLQETPTAYSLQGIPTTLTANKASPTKKKKDSRRDNPFYMPNDEEVFILRDQERKVKDDKKEKLKTLKVHEKTTSSYIHSSTRLDVDGVEPEGLGIIETEKVSKSKIGRPSTESGGKSLSDSDKDRTKTKFRKSVSAAAHTTGGPSNTVARSRPPAPSLANFVASKRSIFLLQYSLAVKREEIQRLDETAQTREDALRKAEKMLEEDAARFDAFLKENNIKTMEATKRADQETKAKLDKVAELKKISGQIGAIRNELAKYDELLEDCRKYKEFLDRLTPPEFQEEIAKKEAQMKFEGKDSLEPVMYFTEPQQLLNIFKSLEEQNMHLIQESQETEKVLEEIRQKRKDTEERMEKEINSLKSQIQSLETAISREKSKARDLTERAGKNSVKSVTLDSQDQDQEGALEILNAKVAEVYAKVVGDLDTNTNSNLPGKISNTATNMGGSSSLSTLHMLTAVERRMEELFEMRESLPKQYLTAAEKAKDKERRQKLREDKLEKQRVAQEMRIKRALDRSQAPVKKREGKPVMFRSTLPEKVRKKDIEEENRKNEEEEELKYFGLLPS
eukprot:TRINITY_DN3551_c0_g2_i1.p1 TRINITY_DN3551_c0_g2~~TRINITY_DN3551_c0_g2_i1.p1  ORF type:complete len:578 (-),score=170.96 TRINITY_DN3551_c0_g2_i1:41-1774(-)